MIIKVKNSLSDNAVYTFLTNTESAGTSVLRWKNPSGFSASWAMQVGKTGEEQTEVVLLGASTPAGTAGTLTANTLYEHPADTPIYAIKYNQVVFERSTAGTAGTATPMTGGTLTLQSDHDYTQFDDTSGASTYAYKAYYRNSVLAVNSTESDWLTPSGFTFYSLAKLRERIKEKLWSDNFVTDDMVTNWINEWQEKVRNVAIGVNEDYALGTMDVAFGTSDLGTITATDFKQIRRMDITYDGSNWQLATKMDSNDWLPNQNYSETDPRFYMKGESVFGVKPANSGGTARILYYNLAIQLVNDTDELPVSMRGYTKSFVDYGLAQALGKDSKNAEAGKKENDAMIELDRFKREIAPRNKTGVTMVQILETVSGDDEFIY